MSREECQDKIRTFIESREITSEEKKDMIKKCVYAELPDDVMNYIVTTPTSVNEILFEIYTTGSEEWYYLSKMVYEICTTNNNAMMEMILSVFEDVSINKLHPVDKYAAYIDQNKERISYNDVCQIKNSIEQQKSTSSLKLMMELNKITNTLKEYVGNLPSIESLQSDIQNDKERIRDLSTENENMKSQLEILSLKNDTSINNKENVTRWWQKIKVKSPRDEDFLIKLMIQERMGKKSINYVNKAISEGIKAKSIIEIINANITDDEDTFCEYINTLINISKKRK